MTGVLVVDDSIIIRKQLERLVDGTRFELLGSAFDGIDAIEQFKTLKPSVVTMDITMPRMDGLQTIREMLQIDPDVRILVISAIRDKRTAMRAIRLGGYGFLYKPFTEYELTQSVTELFEDILMEAV